MNNEEKAKKFLAALKSGLTVKKAATVAEISTPTVYKWAQKSIAFKAEIAKILNERNKENKEGQVKAAQVNVTRKVAKKTVKKVARKKVTPVRVEAPVKVGPEGWIKRVISEFEKAFPGNQLKAKDVLTLLDMAPV